jgi:hypothetical protein
VHGKSPTTRLKATATSLDRSNGRAIDRAHERLEGPMAVSVENTGWETASPGGGRQGAHAVPSHRSPLHAIAARDGMVQPRQELTPAEPMPGGRSKVAMAMCLKNHADLRYP